MHHSQVKPSASDAGMQRLGVRGQGSRTETMLYLSFPTQVSVSLQPGSSRVSKAGSVPKPATAPSDEKKPETAVSRLQRREQLKKSNTLPTSVTGRE